MTQITHCAPEQQAIDTTGVSASILDWLNQISATEHWTHLLAHADDGVIWGAYTTQGWSTCADAPSYAPPPLRSSTLQQLRAFGPESELLVWRHASGWRARIARDGSTTLDESQILWGTQVLQRSAGWTLLADGQQELRHWLPLTIADTALGSANRPARLTVRHSLDYNAAGMAYIALSRLVRIYSTHGGAQ